MVGLLKSLFKRETPPMSAMRLGRNAPCWCGSGTKYKRCHHQADQKYFSRCQAGGSKSPTGGIM